MDQPTEQRTLMGTVLICFMTDTQRYLHVSHRLLATQQLCGLNSHWQQFAT